MRTALAVLLLCATTSCSMTTVKREFRRTGREISRGFSRAGHHIENGLENLFDSGPFRPASTGRANRASSSSSRSHRATPPSPVAASVEPPFASPVPGRTGFVKLPGRDDFPDVDVRGIASGTAVEVPDPGKPGGSIGFRVP
jgi:hypothetical protein